MKRPEMLLTSEAAPTTSTVGERIDIAVGFLRRRYLIILICVLVSLPVGALYYFTSPPAYTATASMMIETRKSPIQDSGSAPADAAWIESQIGILKSQNVAAYVVKQLRLADDPQFTRNDGGPLDKILARLGWRVPEPGSDTERVGRAIAWVMSQLDVRRIGQSYVIRIDFHSQNQEQATRIANAIVDGYISEQLNAKYQANRRAGDWLQERLQTLREQTSAAERAVVEFRAKNNIVRAGGTLMNDKQLTEMSDQLGPARARTLDIQARLERIEAVRKAYQQDQPASAVDETVSEAMSNPVISSLRTLHLDLMNRAADFATRYGNGHDAVIKLRNQIRAVRQSIRDELGRIEETFKSEYAIAKKRQDELEQEMAKLVSRSTETNQAQIALFSLEATAQSYRKMYDSFLQKHTESVQEQSYPISDARSISSAVATKTGPNALKIWIATIFAGGALGVGFGLLREALDRGFRTREHVRTVIDTECLALVPLLTDQSAIGVGFGRQSLPAAARSADFTALGGRSISSVPRILRGMIDAPSSLFAEAIRSIKVAVDLNNVGQSTKVVGLTSCFPNEGKSTIAAAMAALIAEGGASVVLVDCDLRNRSLSRALTPNAAVGFADVVAKKAALADAVWTDPTTRMAFLPAGARSQDAATLLTSEAAKTVFGSLQANFDYVIVDLAPLIAGIDVRSAAHLIDCYVLVIEWGATKVEAVRYALSNAPWLRDHNIVGTVLNKVNMAAMGRYDRYGAHHYYGQPCQAAHN